MENFPTVKLNGVAILDDTGVWYWEATLLTNGLIQVNSKNEFEFNTVILIHYVLDWMG